MALNKAKRLIKQRAFIITMKKKVEERDDFLEKEFDFSKAVRNNK